jgi:hypothetical protein
MKMNWKQVLFLGGAVLLLAACENATAPKPGLRQVKGAASAQGGNGGGGGGTVSDPLVTSTACGSYSVSVGRDTTGTCGLQ